MNRFKACDELKHDTGGKLFRQRNRFFFTAVSYFFLHERLSHSQTSITDLEDANIAVLTHNVCGKYFFNLIVKPIHQVAPQGRSSSLKPKTSSSISFSPGVIGFNLEQISNKLKISGSVQKMP